MPDTCKSLLESLNWCEGRTEAPGMRRRMYFISKSAIGAWPELTRDANGKITTATYTGKFTLLELEKFKTLDTLEDKTSFTSETQGEVPSQTQKNTLTCVFPGTGADATAAAAKMVNDDIIVLAADMDGKYRVLGNDMYPTKVSYKLEKAGGATGASGTTFTFECTDLNAAPYYPGEIDSDAGKVNGNGDPVLGA